MRSVLWIAVLAWLSACAGLRLPTGWRWHEDARCGAPAAAEEECAAQGGWLARPLVCSGVELPPPTPEEERAEEESYRTGEARCTCITSEAMEECATVP